MDEFGDGLSREERVILHHLCLGPDTHVVSQIVMAALPGAWFTNVLSDAMDGLIKSGAVVVDRGDSEWRRYTLTETGWDLLSGNRKET